MSKRKTIIDKLAIMDKPKDFIAKIKDTFNIISTLAETGLIPTHLIQKFIESPILTSPFDFLKTSINSIKIVFTSLHDEIAQLTKYIEPIKSLLSSIRSKFNFMKPIDNLFRGLKPWVDKAIALFSRVFGWWVR